MIVGVCAWVRVCVSVRVLYLQLMRVCDNCVRGCVCVVCVNVRQCQCGVVFVCMSMT